MRPLACFASIALLGCALCLPHASADCIDYEAYMHWITSVPTDPYGTLHDVCLSGVYAYATQQDSSGGSCGFDVFDVGDPAAPRLRGTVLTPGQGGEVIVSGGIAYMTCRDEWRGVAAIDVTDPDRPQLVTALPLSSNPYGLAISGSSLFVANGSGGLLVVDVSDPAVPRLYPEGRTSNRHLPAYDVAVSESAAYAFVADIDALKVVDITDPRELQVVGIAPGGGGGSIAVAGPWAYTITERELRVTDISDPGNPRLVATLPDGGGFALTVSGTHVLVASWQGVKSIDVSVPDAPRLNGIAPSRDPAGVAASGRYAFLADDSAGLSVMDLGNYQPPPILGGVPDLRWVEHLAVSGIYAYIPGHDWPAGQFSVVDIADPSSSHLVGSIVTEAGAMGAAVSGNHAFVTTRYGYDDSRFSSVDVSDPTDPFIIGGVNLPGWADCIAISGDYAYVCTRETLQVIRIANPATPVRVSHDAIPSEGVDLALTGNRVYVACRGTGLLIFDIGNPANPGLLGTFEIGNWTTGVAVSGTTAFVTEGHTGLWVIDCAVPESPVVLGMGAGLAAFEGVAVDGSTAYVMDWAGCVEVFDVADLESPRNIGRVRLPGSIAQKGIIRGEEVYVADGARGLQIIPTHCQSRLIDTPEAGIAPAHGIGIEAFPNPASRGAHLVLRLSEPSRVAVTIHDIRGRRVRVLGDGEVLAGGMRVLLWDGRDDQGRPVPAGVYLGRAAIADGGTSIARCVMLP
ncbi:MAG: hypothetical protein ACE15D_10965 [Candidatus Eisenbacteria bacterium]|nr:hypothetical protein [Candidatus Eisenbacteria bacterium]